MGANGASNLLVSQVFYRLDVYFEAMSVFLD